MIFHRERYRLTLRQQVPRPYGHKPQAGILLAEAIGMALPVRKMKFSTGTRKYPVIHDKPDRATGASDDQVHP